MVGSEGRERRELSTLAALAANTQDVLGELHDATTCSATLTNFAKEHETDAPLNLAVGRLLERQERSASEARRCFWKSWPRLERRYRSALRDR
jgi:CHAD domain-containing protein